jgi:serine/threonine protein kinase
MHATSPRPRAIDEVVDSLVAFYQHYRSSNNIHKQKKDWIVKFVRDGDQNGWPSTCKTWIRKRRLFRWTRVNDFKVCEKTCSVDNVVLTCLQKDIGDFLTYVTNGSTNLGSGTFGSVQRMHLTSQPGTTVAVKNYISPNEGAWLNNIRDAIVEINTLKHFAGVNGIVQMKLAVLASNEKGNKVKEICLAMPLYECDLHAWIFLKQQRKSDSIKEDARFSWVCASFRHFCLLTTQLARAVDVLHRNGFLHRDIKTPNMLISADEQSVVLSDMGSALCLYPGLQNRQLTDTASLWWRCPEHIEQRSSEATYHTSTAADLWSLAVCIVELIIGRCPYDNCSTEKEVLLCQRRDCAGSPVKDSSMSAVLTNCNASSLYSQIFLMQLSHASLDIASAVVCFVFENMLHLNPTQRVPAHQVAQFFAEQNVRNLFSNCTSSASSNNVGVRA